MNDITEIVTEALANADRAATEYACWKAEWERRTSNRSALVYKDFSGEQPPAYEVPPVSPTLVRAIGEALSEVRYKLRQEQSDAVAELMARITAIETDVAMLDARLAALEDNGVNAIKYLDSGLEPCDEADANYVRVERLLKIIRKGGSGYAG